MSRTGKKPILLPEKVNASCETSRVVVKGPLGSLSVALDPHVRVAVDAKKIDVTRTEETREGRMFQGLIRALLANAVTGVSQGFKKNLEIEGIGYRAEVKGSSLQLLLGFSHPVLFPIPRGIRVDVEKQVKIAISGINRELVGQVAANIRDFRPPEPYKGKGIRYEGEVVQRKVGKAAAAAGGAK